jgi:hypothetical protein
MWQKMCYGEFGFFATPARAIVDHSSIWTGGSSWGSRRLAAGRLLPARLMKNGIMRMPEPIPFGMTRLLAAHRATAAAFLVKRLAGGKVETVCALCDHFLLR